MKFISKNTILITYILFNGKNANSHLVGIAHLQSSGPHYHSHENHRTLLEGEKCGYEAPPPPEEAEITEILKQTQSNKLNYNTGVKIAVNTYFHLLIDNVGKGNVTDETIEKQVKILNEAFGGIQNSEYNECENMEYDSTVHLDSAFEFNLSGIYRYQGDDTFGIDNVASIQLRSESRNGTCADLNIFSGKYSSSLLGKSTRPGTCPDALIDDYVTIRYETLPGGNLAPFNQGDTLVHEVGHWLGLDHTFQRGCSFPGDSVDDTAYQGSSTEGCPVSKDTCPRLPGIDPIHNFMDYSDDCCMYHFTEGQILRMRALAAKFRGLEVDFPSTSPTTLPTSTVPPSVFPTRSPTEFKDPLVILAEGLVEYFNFPEVIVCWAQSLVDFLESFFFPSFHRDHH